jgi:hypothetical protein
MREIVYNMRVIALIDPTKVIAIDDDCPRYPNGCVIYLTDDIEIEVPSTVEEVNKQLFGRKNKCVKKCVKKRKSRKW